MPSFKDFEDVPYSTDVEISDINNFGYSSKQLLIISIALSTITCAFIQKTKMLFKSSKYIEYYSFLVNMLVSVIFCITFTDIKFPNSLWIGLFSFLGADSLYKSLEGKISSHKDIINKKTITIPEENIINKEDENGKTNIPK